MEMNTIDERFDRYLEGNMSEEEQHVFETELSGNPDIKVDFEEHVWVLNSITAYNRLLLKNDLALLAGALTANAAYDTYTPSKISSSWLTWLKWFMLIAGIGGVLYYGYKNKDKLLHVKDAVHQQFENIRLDSAWTQETVKYDTVWKEIKTNKLPEGTVIIEQPQNNEKVKTKIIYDTIYSEE